MAVRIPQSISGGLNHETGWNVLEYEILQQKAHTLGALDGQVEQALVALRDFDARADAVDREARRTALLNEAADRVWALMIQRELCDAGKAW